jgi:glycosyltransferase involved in cell wall biosynthesis
MFNKKINLNLTLIIPLKDNFFLMRKNLQQMKYWSKLPSELIIVDSSKKKFSHQYSFLIFCKKKRIRVLTIHKKNLFPGKSRNIGIKKAKNSILAFLDVNTAPNNQWLEESFNLLIKSSSQIIWGSTKYMANFSNKNILAATYGFKPIQTLPGTVVYKNIFDITGLFLENIRAGEDGDWKSRVILHNLTSTVNKNYLIYKFKNNHIYSRLLKKWYRNYSYAAKLPFFAVHKNIYYYFVMLFLLLFSLTWNPYFVKTYEYGFFIPHLAKGSLLLIIIFYLIIRSIYFPLKKGMSFLSLFPFNFIKILIFSFLIDIVKTFAFVKARMNFK